MKLFDSYGVELRVGDDVVIALHNKIRKGVVDKFIEGIVYVEYTPPNLIQKQYTYCKPDSVFVLPV